MSYDITEVTVRDMAQSREARVLRQQQLALQCGDVPNGKDGYCVISFMLNIAGAVKRKPLYDRAFREGVRRIEAALEQAGGRIIKREIAEKFTGNEYLACVALNALQAKGMLIELEEMDKLGRIFDIDVLTPDFHKVERREVGREERKCLLCNEKAHVCARNRTHSVASLVSAIDAIISEQLSE